MAGGVSIWVGPEAKTDPKQIFNLRLLFLVFTVSWAGCFYGLDTGNIGGILTLKSFRHAFGLDTLSADALDNREGNIAAMRKSALYRISIKRKSLRLTDTCVSRCWWLFRCSTRSSRI